MARHTLLRLLLLAALAASAVASAVAAPPARAATTSARIVSHARAELARGVREAPDGSNRGARIRTYGLSTAGRFYPAPWCAYFVSYVTRKAGVPIGPGGRGLGYVPYIRSWARQTGRWTQKPRPGYLITFPQHVGIVETVSANGTLTTIEGNAGNAVRRRWRRWSEATGYVRLAAGGALSAPGAEPAPRSPSGQRLRARITAYPGWSIAAGQRVDLTSNDSSGTVARADWDLGSGRFTKRGDNVSPVYREPGTYTIRLKVRDRGGRTATATKVLTVRSNHAPVAKLVVSPAAQVVADTTITADASGSADTDGRIVRWSWDLTGTGRWEDGGPRRTTKLSAPGDYTLGLRVYDDDGNVTETHAPVRVTERPPPVLRAICAAAAIASGQRLTCRADTTGSAVPVSRVEWDMNGDGTFESAGTTVGWTYRAPGSQTIRARATDRRGRTTEAAVGLVVTNRAPVAKLRGPSSVGLGRTATLDASGSSDPDGTIAGYAWDLDGDGKPDAAPAASPRTSFTPDRPGPRTVRVWVTDALGGVGTASLALTVTNAAPVARIAGPASAVAGAPVTLDASGSSDADGQIARYEWDLDGDGTYAEGGASITATFAAGTVTVRLRVTDAFGATATGTKRITVS